MDKDVDLGTAHRQVVGDKEMAQIEEDLRLHKVEILVETTTKETTTKETTE